MEKITKTNEIVDLTNAFVENKNKAFSRSYLIFRPDHTLEQIDLENRKEVTLEELQKIVDGYIEPVQVRGSRPMVKMLLIANEEGLLKGLPRNILIEEIFGMMLVGNVVLISKALLK